MALVPPEGGRDWYTGAEAIRIDARALAGADPANLAVELDGTDVTSWARRAGSEIVLFLPTPPAPGRHRIQVYEWRDPNWIDHGGSEFDVRGSGTVQEAWLRTNLDGEIDYRAADNGFDFPTETDRTEGRAAIDMTGRMATKWGSLDLRAPFVYDSNAPHGSFASSWTAADYLAELRMGRFTAKVGHHAQDLPSLIMEGFTRRGLSAQVDVPGGVHVSGFVYRTDPIVGFRESFGVTDEERRLLGGTVNTRAYDFGLGQISAGGTWYQASGPATGTAVGADPDFPRYFESEERGSAWTSVVDTAFLDQRIRLRGEYAHTKFDFDGSGGRPAEEDHAWAGDLVLNPFPSLVILEQPMAFELHYSESDVGTFFRALGNPGKDADLHTRDAGFDFYWAGLAVRGLHTRFSDNRDDRDDQLTMRDDNWSVDAAYTPHWLTVPRETGWVRVLGTPTVTGGWWRARRKPIANSGLLDPNLLPTIDNTLQFSGFNTTRRQAYFSVGSQWSRGRVDYTQTVIRTDDALVTDADVRTTTRSLSFNAVPTERLLLNGSLQRERTRFRDPTFESQSVLVSLGMRGAVVPRRLVSELNVSWAKSWNQFNTVDSRTLLYSTALTWKAIESKGNLPGLTFALVGNYSDVTDEANSGNDRSAYQTYLRLTIDWVGSLGKGVERW